MMIIQQVFYLVVGMLQTDELLIPNFKNVGLGLQSSINRLGNSFDQANFLKPNHMVNTI